MSKFKFCTFLPGSVPGIILHTWIWLSRRWRIIPYVKVFCFKGGWVDEWLDPVPDAFNIVPTAPGVGVHKDAVQVAFPAGETCA